MARPFRGSQLAQRLRFNLTDALSGDVKFLPDLFEGVLALAAAADAQADHLLFFGRQGLQNIGGFVADVGVDDGVHGGADPAVFNQVAQRRLAIPAHRRFERNRIARDSLQLLDLLHRNVHAAADFVVRRSPAEFLFKLARGAQELVHALVHVYRDTDGARLVGDGARDRLANPPGGVSGELVTAPVFELVGGAHQADVAFLDQVQQVQPAIDVLLRDGNHQAKVGFHQVLFGALGFDLAVPDDRHAVLQIAQRCAGGILQLPNFAAQLPGTSLGCQPRAAFQFAQLDFQVGQLLDGVLDLLGELLPAGRQPGQAPD